MANWFYYDANGEKIAVTGNQLQALAQQGTITPETVIETEDGRRGAAGKLGLAFPKPKPPQYQPEEPTYGVKDDFDFPAPQPVYPPNTAPVAPYTPQPQPFPVAGLFCAACGNPVVATAQICPKCGSPIIRPKATPVPTGPPKSRQTFILLGALMLGAFGIHNFYIGRTGLGIIQLLITLCSGFALAGVSWIWAIVEICTVKEDANGNPLV